MGLSWLRAASSRRPEGSILWNAVTSASLGEMAEQVGNWDECLLYAAVTDVGMRRLSNQDSHAVVLAADDESWRLRGHVFMVADGMGAHAAGELASELAVTGVPHHYHKYLDLPPPDALRKAFQETNAEVHRRGQANADFLNMGTTASVLALLPQSVLVAHIGDSRVYRLRGECLDQLTFDHSLVWEMRRAGHLSEASELYGAIPKNVITRSLGPNATVQVDVEGPFPLRVGDTFLVCSDGLTGQLKDDELGPILASLPPEEAANISVDLANLRGGPDNITAIVVKVVGERIAEGSSEGEAVALAGKQPKASVHPALWVTTGVFLLAALGMLIADQPMSALLAACAGALSWVAGILRKRGGGSQPVLPVEGRRQGGAPYASTRCPTLAELVERLEEEIAQLRSAGNAPDWIAASDLFDEYCRKAAAAVEAGQLSRALRERAAAIRLAVQHLRSRAGGKTNDWVIDY